MSSVLAHMMSIWNASAMLLVFAMTAIVMARWKSLPEKIPGRYDMNGRPETWTGRKAIWLYPILAFAVLAFLSAADGAKMAPVGLFLAAMLLYQMLRTFAIADRRADRLPPWFIPVLTFGVILLALFIYL